MDWRRRLSAGGRKHNRAWQAAGMAVPPILAILLPGVAHGPALPALGDPTAAEAPRLTRNPLRRSPPDFATLSPADFIDINLFITLFNLLPIAPFQSLRSACLRLEPRLAGG